VSGRRCLAPIAASLAAAVGALLAAACAPADADAHVSFALPQAFLECAAPPPELQARLWVSGSAVPCDLTVDGAVTSGTCTVTPGRLRTLTLDWYVVSDRGIDLLLAQAQEKLDLTQAAEPQVALELSSDDVRTGRCSDMRADQLEGSPTITLAGNEVPVCDVDDSCAGADELRCSNLGEVCAGADPFDPAVEP
jgi:hypothetical protein